MGAYREAADERESAREEAERRREAERAARHPNGSADGGRGETDKHDPSPPTWAEPAVFGLINH